MIEELFFKDRSKRIARIAASAAPRLEDGEEIRVLFQVQSGQAAEWNRVAVQQAGERGRVDRRTQGVQSFAVIATDRNVYVVTLTGWRLLDLGEIVYKEPIARTRMDVHDDYVALDETVLHVMNHWDAQVAAFRELLGSHRSPT